MSVPTTKNCHAYFHGFIKCWTPTLRIFHCLVPGASWERLIMGCAPTGQEIKVTCTLVPTKNLNPCFRNRTFTLRLPAKLSILHIRPLHYWNMSRDHISIDYYNYLLSSNNIVALSTQFSTNFSISKRYLRWIRTFMPYLVRITSNSHNLIYWLY